MRRFRPLTLIIVSFVFLHPVAAQLRFEVKEQSLIEERLKLSTRSNSERYQAMKKLFADAGCAGERLTEQPVPHVKLPNVICALPGTGDSIIIVGAHFDAVADGFGVVDNWSGVSLLPSFYETLSKHPHQHTFIFIAFSGEEQGLLGSEYYAKKLTPDEKKKIHAMVNLDTMGLGPTNVWASHSDNELTSIAAGIGNALKLEIRGVNVEQVGSTDSDSFFKRKIPVLSFHSVTQETWPILHTTRDNLTAIRMDDYYGSYRLITACLNYLDAYLLRPKEERMQSPKKKN